MEADDASKEKEENVDEESIASKDLKVTSVNRVEKVPKAVYPARQPVRLIPIGLNQRLFSGLIYVRHGRIRRRKRLSRITRTIQRIAEERFIKLGQPIYHPAPEKPTKEKHFLTKILPRFREKIWRLLDERTKIFVRQVCREFRAEVDKGAGLEIIVNDQASGNLEFIQSVEATEACLLHLKNTFFRTHSQVLRCNWNLETIDSWMQLNLMTFKHLILDCSQTLQCIYFREMALMRKYISASKADESHTYSFPCLTTILVYYGYFESPAQKFKIFNANMRYILTTFDCPKLNNLQILPEPSVIDELVHEKRSILHESCHWETHPLKSFISKHHALLRKLKLVLYRSYLSPELENYHPPTELIEYVILFPMLEPVVLRNFRSFWRVILQAQVEVQVISGQAELWGDFASMSKSLRKNVFLFSASSLTKIYLESYHRKPAGEGEITHILDLKQFYTFHGLTELHLNVIELGKKGDSFYATHLTGLPKKIEILVIEGFQCLSADLMYIAAMPKLTRATVKNCGTEGLYGVTFEVARSLLMHKNIRLVAFGGFNEKNDTRQLYALIKKFNMGKYENEFEVVNPRDRISVIDWFPCCCCMKPHGEENINLH